jgi:hypothetical protein
MAPEGQGTMKTVSSSRETAKDERATSSRKRSGQGAVGIVP